MQRRVINTKEFFFYKATNYPQVLINKGGQLYYRSKHSHFVIFRFSYSNVNVSNK